MAYEARKCYIVTFEVAQGPSREKLVALLKDFGSYCPIHANAWAILTELTAAQVRDRLSPAIAPPSRLFVIRSGVESAWMNSYGEKNNEWLKENL